MAKLALRVNGGSRAVESDDPDIPLLHVLRNDLGLTGTHFGCGLAQCGACTVLVDGRAVRSCTAPASAVVGREVVTIEGLGSPAPIRSRRPSSRSRRRSAGTARPAWS
jgi:aerobic-type carbon monoxide dehydrogenase small subunit (CoxS/CutS family)